MIFLSVWCLNRNQKLINIVKIIRSTSPSGRKLMKMQKKLSSGKFQILIRGAVDPFIFRLGYRRTPCWRSDKWLNYGDGWKKVWKRNQALKFARENMIEIGHEEERFHVFGISYGFGSQWTRTVSHVKKLGSLGTTKCGKHGIAPSHDSLPINHTETMV